MSNSLPTSLRNQDDSFSTTTNIIQLPRFVSRGLLMADDPRIPSTLTHETTTTAAAAAATGASVMNPSLSSSSNLLSLRELIFYLQLQQDMERRRIQELDSLLQTLLLQNNRIMPRTIPFQLGQQQEATEASVFIASNDDASRYEAFNHFFQPLRERSVVNVVLRNSASELSGQDRIEAVVSGLLALQRGHEDHRDQLTTTIGARYAIAGASWAEPRSSTVGAGETPLVLQHIGLPRGGGSEAFFGTAETVPARTEQMPHFSSNIDVIDDPGKRTDGNIRFASQAEAQEAEVAGEESSTDALSVRHSKVSSKVAPIAPVGVAHSSPPPSSRAAPNTTDSTPDLSTQNKERSDEKEGNGQRVPKLRKKRKYDHESFAQKLHRMITETELQGKGDIISFLNDNSGGFQVHKPIRFVKDIMPNFLRCSTWSSFRRQLFSYNFPVQKECPDKRVYTNPLFVRGRPDLCARIERDDRYDKNTIIFFGPKSRRYD